MILTVVDKVCVQKGICVCVGPESLSVIAFDLERTEMISSPVFEGAHLDPVSS